MSLQTSIGKRKPLPTVAVVFISIALGFGFVLLYSCIFVLARIRARRRDTAYKTDTDLELAETAELLATNKRSLLEVDDDDDSEDDEDRVQQDGLDVSKPSAGDGSAVDSSMSPNRPPSSEATSDGRDVQSRKAKGKKPVRNDSIQDGAAGPDAAGPLDDLKDEIDRQLAEIEDN